MPEPQQPKEVIDMGAALPATEAITVGELVTALTDAYSRRARLDAAKGLMSLGEKAKAAVPALINALSDEDQEVRFWVANALAAIGPEAREALDALGSRLENGEHALVRSAVEHAIRKIVGR